jgi:hypothetical protein
MQRNAWLFLIFAGFLTPIAVGGSGCSCQRPENVAAKERMKKPPPPDPMAAQAEEVLQTRSFGKDPALTKRVNRMRYDEMRRRLGSFKLNSEGSLSFARGEGGLSSSEKLAIVQTNNDDFSLLLETGKDGRMEVAYINGVLFLKNRNGKWRASRDPTGERKSMIDDAAGVWRSFYDLFAHAVQFAPIGEGNFNGKGVAKFAIRLPDQSKEATEMGQALPEVKPPPDALLMDGGFYEESETDRKTREAKTNERIKKWRERSRPAGGAGEIWLDTVTAVPVKVQFTGALLVGDSPNPAKMDIVFTSTLTDIGHAEDVPAPKDAVEEFAREKWPVNPRKFLEDEGLVPPLPPEEKAGGKKPSDGAAGTEKPKSP